MPRPRGVSEKKWRSCLRKVEAIDGRAISPHAICYAALRRKKARKRGKR